jgi:nucleoside-diphosphate kinase
MAANITFTMIKPYAVECGNIGTILDIIITHNFKIKAMKYTRLSKSQAEKFYSVHKDRPFFNDLVEFMSSGPIVAAMLEKENAVEDYRQLIGSTDPAKAAEGTIRRLYGYSVQKNAVHGSDSDENAIIESNFFFPTSERF